VSFLPPAPPKKDETKKQGHQRTRHLVPEYYIVSRKGPQEKEFREVARLEPKPAVDERAPRRRGGPPPPAGVPDGPPPPGPAVPRPLRPGPGPATPGGPTRLSYVDRSVESESAYDYTVQAFAKDPSEKVLSSDLIKVSCKTKARFSFAYVGGTGTVAQIIVFIGPREDNVWKEYRVHVGGWVGDSPAIASTPAAGEGGEGPAADAEAPDLRFVTRFVLTDIIFDAFRLVPQTVRRLERGPDGKTRVVEETGYRQQLDKLVVLRNRKNRFQRIWLERRPKLAASTKTPAARPSPPSP
jgi:hypothetical protein